jgi:phage protein D
MAARDQFDTLAPEFAIHINGSPLPNKAVADMISINVVEDLDATSMCTVTLSGWDTVEMKVKWIDHKLFREGNPIKIEMGYRDHLQLVFSGEITGLEPDFPEARPATFTVRAYDRRHRLMRQRKTQSFTNLKDSDIAGQLAHQAGLDPKVEDSKVKLPYVLQHNQTDLEFLLWRAQRIDYEVVVEDRTLLFRPRKIGKTAKLTLRRDIELLEFRPRMTTMGQVEEFTVRGWNAKEKKEIVAHSTTGDLPTVMGGTTSGPANVQQVFSKTGSTLVTVPVQSQEEADRIAKQRFSEIALSYVRAEGKCIGDPQLRAGIVVKVEGLGERFSGLYYVRAVEHRYSMQKGYRTAFSARRNAT